MVCVQRFSRDVLPCPVVFSIRSNVSLCLRTPVRCALAAIMTTSSIARTLEAVAHTRGLITIYHNVVNGGGVLIFEAALFRTAVSAYRNAQWRIYGAPRTGIGMLGTWTGTILGLLLIGCQIE